MADDGLRGAVIGCGFFAPNHLHAWRAIAGVELVAVCDLDAVKASRAAADFAVPQHFTDPQTMFERDRFDFIDIVTTPESHRPLVELAAAHRVPAIVQKPFGRTLTECEAMVEACRAAGVVLMVHENFRFQRPIMAVRAVLEQGRLGEPFFARISWRTGFDVFAGQPYLAEEESLILYDVGVHLLDVARFLFGDVNEVACRLASVRPGIKGEDAATLLLAHESGTTTVVDCTYSAHIAPDPFPQTLIEIDGSQGSLRLRQGYDLVVTTAEGTERHDVAPRKLPWASRPWEAIQESVLVTQQHFIESLRTRRVPATSGKDNLKTFALVEAAYASAARSATVFPPL